MRVGLSFSTSGIEAFQEMRMRLARRLTAALLLLVAGGPLLFPLLEALRAAPEPLARDAGRLLHLAGQTALLIILTLLFTLPLGTILAVLLYRSDMPGRRVLRGLLLIALFVPLPVFASAWQAALGAGGWIGSLLQSWGLKRSGPWTPWDQGLVPAAGVHALASLPWVVWIIGQGITWVEPELEEDALQAARPRRVLWLVTFRRARPALAIAALWVVAQTAGEITVTDAMMVRTFAEEVYTEFATNTQGLGRAVLLALPQIIGVAALALIAVRRWERRAPPLVSWPQHRDWLDLGWGRWVCFGAVLLAVGLLAGVPLVSLIWKAGGGAGQAGWSGHELQTQLRLTWVTGRGVLLDSLLWSCLAGAGAALLALVACWLARDSRWFRIFLLLMAVGAWIVPGPVLGYGLKEEINRLMDLEDLLLGGWMRLRPLRAALYDQPWPLPILWIDIIRVFPFAVALLWPAVRSVPRDVTDAARVDGAGPLQELRMVVWPLCRNMTARAVVVGTVLALGELSAGKMVEVPGRWTFAQELFQQMHYGTPATVAALCLMQLALTVVIVALLLQAGEPRISFKAKVQSASSSPTSTASPV
jgi:iron(III) transport system permease protein